MFNVTIVCVSIAQAFSLHVHSMVRKLKCELQKQSVVRSSSRPLARKKCWTTLTWTLTPPHTAPHHLPHLPSVVSVAFPSAQNTKILLVSCKIVSERQKFGKCWTKRQKYPNTSNYRTAQTIKLVPTRAQTFILTDLSCPSVSFARVLGISQVMKGLAEPFPSFVQVLPACKTGPGQNHRQSWKLLANLVLSKYWGQADKLFPLCADLWGFKPETFEGRWLDSLKHHGNVDDGKLEGSFQTRGMDSHRNCPGDRLEFASEKHWSSAQAGGGACRGPGPLSVWGGWYAGSIPVYHEAR